MQKILIILSLTLIAVSSCNKDSTADSTSPCDKGSIEVKNRTRDPIYVSVGSQSTGINNGSFYTWSSIPKGNIQVAAKPMTGDPNVQWTYFSSVITGCETASLTITGFK